MLLGGARARGVGRSSARVAQASIHSSLLKHVFHHNTEHVSIARALHRLSGSRRGVAFVMSGHAPGPRQDLAESSMTIPSDSENYSSGTHNDQSPSPPSSSTSPMILYTPPTIWGLLRGAAINLLLPFVNGLMLGFGELFAHEAAFRLGWSGTKV